MGFGKSFKKAVGSVSKFGKIATDTVFGTNFYGSSQDWKHQQSASNTAFNQQHNLIHEQNLYNSPQAQMQRLQSAGLNPNLVYGQISSGNQTSLADVPRVYKQYSNRNLGNIGKQLASVYFQQQNLHIQNQRLVNESLHLNNESQRLDNESKRLNIFESDFLLKSHDWKNLDNRFLQSLDNFRNNFDFKKYVNNKLNNTILNGVNSNGYLGVGATTSLLLKALFSRIAGRFGSRYSR